MTLRRHPRTSLAAVSLLLAAACARPAPPGEKVGVQAAAAEERRPGLTRVAAAVPTSAVDHEVDAPLDATAASAPPAPTSLTGTQQGTSFGAAGLGLSGVGTGGGGIGHGLGGGSGHGRLGGTHKSSGSFVRAVAMRGDESDVEFNTENYAHVNEEAFVDAKTEPRSTFSVDVDTASYSNARRFLNQGSLPPRDAIRVEEWLNYFGYDYAKPKDTEPFSVDTEVTTAPWNPSHRLVRIGLSGAPLADEQTPARNLVFLLDVSGSMGSPDKLPLVQKGLGMLADNLRAIDTLSIVVYAGASGLVLPPTSGNQTAKIRAALENLEAGGSTNGGEGIRLAYAMAQESMKPGGINRVILATDGDFNVGTTSEGELQRLIEEKRKTGVFLTVLGFGSGNVKDATMEMLADKGNGNYAYVDSELEAKKVLVREAGATLVTIAKDVKLQVEFNPRLVASYKLIGYENRRLATRDFNDDKKDAGEIGAGHRVTALYEIVPQGATSSASTSLAGSVLPLKYQGPGSEAPAAAAAELLTINLRYKKPNGDKSALLSVAVPDRVKPLAETSVDTRFSIAVAEAALLLRGSDVVKGATLAQARALAQGAVGTDRYGDRREFLALLDKARALSPH